MSSIAEQSQYEPIKCKNYGKLGYEHWILPNPNSKSYNLEKHGICGVCAILAFQDNTCATNPLPIKKQRPYIDSKINNKYFIQCGSDTL